MDIVELIKKIVCIRKWEEASGATMFMGIPERWYGSAHFRCPNNHVSVALLKSEGLKGDVCLQCFAPVALTFPEDTDGPLVHKALEKKTMTKETHEAALKRILSAQGWEICSDERGLAMGHLDALIAENTDLKNQIQPSTEVEESGLKPCPFCNCSRLYMTSVPRFPGLPKEWSGSTAYNILCGGCAAMGGWEKSRDGARRTWNMRPGEEP